MTQVAANGDEPATKAPAEKLAAETRSAIAAADKAEREERQARITSLIPDFSKIQRGTLDTSKAGEALFGSALSLRALEAAAENVAKEAADAMAKDVASILVTSETDLAASDAAYHDMTAALDHLHAAADAVLNKQQAKSLVAVGAALAGALPAIASLLATNRTITSASVKPDDLAAAAATVAAMKAHPTKRFAVTHDEFRVVDAASETHKRFKELRDKRQDLSETKASLEADDADKHKREISEITDVLATIDTFAATATTVPEGSSYSPLTRAALRAALHADGTSRIRYVLLVKGATGGVQQMVEERFLREDKFSVIAVASVSYMLLDVESNNVIRAGNPTASAAATGKIGDAFKLGSVSQSF